MLWDVTEQRSTWRTLQDKKAYLAALVQTAPIGILSVDEKGMITRSNSLMDELLGPLPYGTDVLAHAQRWKSELGDGTPLVTTEYPILQVLRGASRSEVEVRHRPPGGRDLMWLRLIASPVMHQGKSVGAVMACIDVDAERQAMEALKEADARKEQFFAILAHEIRNPLAAISNAIHILSRDANLSEPSTFATGVITRQSKQLQNLVNDLLEVSRFSRDSFTLHRARTSIPRLVMDSCGSALIRAQVRGQRFSIKLPDHDIVATVDSTRFSQVLDNLLGNAIKYTQEGGSIEVTLQEKPAVFELTVADNGMGIERSELEKIFELFHQQKSAIRHAALGLGIGLSMVRRLVELHDGKVWAESAGPGMGSRFVVQLPLNFTKDPIQVPS